MAICGLFFLKAGKPRDYLLEWMALEQNCIWWLYRSDSCRGLKDCKAVVGEHVSHPAQTCGVCGTDEEKEGG